MSKIICHAHCPRGSHGKGWAVLLAVLVVAAILAARAVSAAAPALESGLRELVHILEIAAITVAAAAGLAAAGWIAHSAQHARSSHATAGHAIPRHTPTTGRSAQPLSAPRAPLAIEAPDPYAAETTGVTDAAAPIADRNTP